MKELFLTLLLSRYGLTEQDIEVPFDEDLITEADVEFELIVLEDKYKLRLPVGETYSPHKYKREG